MNKNWTNKSFLCVKFHRNCATAIYNVNKCRYLQSHTVSVSVQLLLNVALPPMFGQIFQVALQSHQWCCCDASYQDPAAGAVLVCWTQLSSIFREIGSGAWTCRVVCSVIYIGCIGIAFFLKKYSCL